jgi:hypothetical protein
VTVYEAGETEHGFFIAMRLIRGPNLKSMIVSGRLDPGLTLRVLGPIADALDAAHEAGLIHRDVKPQNILVGARDQGFLADFGLTKASGATSLTKTGQFVGTFDYISPEQIRGEGATVRSDVYSLAAVLYECLTGTVPFPRDSDAATLYAHVSEPPPRVTERRPELPTGLDEVLAAGMAKDPAGRYGSAGELVREAGERLGRQARAASVPPAPATVPGETRIRPAREPSETVPADADETVPAEPPDRGDASAPASPPVPRRAGTRALVGLTAGLLLVVAAGFVVGSSSGGGDSDAPENVARAGALALRFPDTWRRAADPLDVPGLKLADPIGLAERARPRDGLLSAGTTDATGRALLPPELLDRLEDPPKQDDPVTLGALGAYRYEGLRPRGFKGPLTLFVAPTTEGVATVACTSPGCERVAGGLRLVRGKAFALGADRGYLGKLDAAIGRLNAARKRDTAALRSAKQQPGQAGAARSLASDFRRARRSLRGLVVSPAVLGASRSVQAALARTELAYERLAASASDGDETAYEHAREGVSAGEAALSRALKQVARSS